MLENWRALTPGMLRSALVHNLHLRGKMIGGKQSVGWETSSPFEIILVLDGSGR